MKTITSRENALYKELKLLASNSQARKKSGKTLLDGVHLCVAYLQHCGLPQLCVVAESALQNREVQSVLESCALITCISLPDALYNALSQVENGIGLLFVIATPAPKAPATLHETSLFLDNLQDPGNLGSILRSAAGAGVKYVYCGQGTAFAWAPKVMRAGMGAHFALHIFEQQDLPQLLQSVQIPVLATSSHTLETIYQADLNQPVVWLFGHEGQGVSPELMALATQTVTIPQNPAIESLNVAASVAVCLFEQVRQIQFAKNPAA
jgi:TrmH family RNA methyltransferase